jgi:hypothetical protein
MNFLIAASSEIGIYIILGVFGLIGLCVVIGASKADID